MPARGPRGLAWGLGACLLVAGAAALLHQAAWFRMLVPVLGAGALAAGVVSAGALLGLALGAAVGGQAAGRVARPLLLVGLAEALGAALAAPVPLLASLLQRAVTASDASQPVLGAPGAALLCTAACALAAFPLGATVPAALAALRAQRAGAAPAFRWLYGVNTLGAVLGVLLAAGLALEHLGNRGSVLLACLLQVLVAGVALLMAWRGRPVEPVATSPEPATLPSLAARAALPWGVAAAAALAGAAGLAVQVAWVRRLTPAVGTTTQSFATVLAAHLLAIALGSLLCGPRRGSRDRSVRVLLLSALPVALLPAAIAPVAAFTSEHAQGAVGPFALLGVRALAACLLLVPSTLLAAAALPWLLQRLAACPLPAARAAGAVVMWNTLGSALGALSAGALWIPAAGSAGVLRGAAGLLVLAAACLLPRRPHALGTAAAGLLLLLQPWLLPLEDAAGRDAVGAAFLPAQFAIADAPALYAREGSATTVVVREREGHRELWVEGKIEASTQPTDRLHLSLLGALPMALHPAPERVAIVGLGTGRTAQAVAAFAPRRLLVLEIEREVAEAVHLFAADGGGLPHGATLRLGDARHSLARSRERFDVITSDPVHPGVAGSAALYSREMYALVRERLAPGGLLCQWLPLYQLTPDDLRLALRTFVRAFPEGWVFLAGEDLILVGSLVPLRVDEEALRLRLLGPAGGPLQPLGLARPGRLLGLVLKGPQALARFAGEGPLNTDDRLRLEFQAGRSWFINDPQGNLMRLWPGRARAAELLASAPSERFLAEVEGAGRLYEAVRSWLAGDDTRAAEAFEALAGADPADRFAREMAIGVRVREASGWAADGRLPEAQEAARALARRDGLTPTQRLDVAALLREAGLDEEGRALASEVGRSLDAPRARRLSAP